MHSLVIKRIFKHQTDVKFSELYLKNTKYFGLVLNRAIIGKLPYNL